MREELRVGVGAGVSVLRRDIPALDGVRAMAALSVVFFHSYQLESNGKLLFGLDLTIPWDYTQTGVHLFFVLSGLLLFLPYARALLDGKPLPSAASFYKRRAWRILPTYWVCMIVLVLVQLPAFLSLAGLENIATHTVLLHDNFRRFNRTIEGPFWTLAVEVQFYALLPLLTAGIERLMRGSRSPARLLLGVLGVMAAAFLLRGIGAVAQNQRASLSGAPAAAAVIFVRATLGMQGKFLEVFATGMLCAALYVLVSERRGLNARMTRWLGLGLLGAALVAFATLAPLVHRLYIEVPPYDIASQPGNWLAFFGPFLVGLGYAMLVLAVLWTGGLLAAVFALGPLRFLGIMSYSLYLWHLPFVHGIIPFARALPLGWRVVTAFAVAYLSYRLLERPFLQRASRRSRPATCPRGQVPAEPGPPPSALAVEARSASSVLERGHERYGCGAHRSIGQHE